MPPVLHPRYELPSGLSGPMFRGDYESGFPITEGAMRYDTTHEGTRDTREAPRGSGEGGSFLVDGQGTIVGFDGSATLMT